MGIWLLSDQNMCAVVGTLGLAFPAVSGLFCCKINPSRICNVTVANLNQDAIVVASITNWTAPHHSCFMLVPAFAFRPLLHVLKGANQVCELMRWGPFRGTVTVQNSNFSN
ncbi:hypothetical protein PYTT13_01405 [Paracoccus yeei]|uniref:Uncharacterized protein n=1 Tax=Paracoccus yeei TaxID=147645 RepID=A0A2D2BWD5_9RHOB|nr:hypothetical protein PYTT13_01405 [Paracoccus yeei]